MKLKLQKFLSKVLAITIAITFVVSLPVFAENASSDLNFEVSENKFNNNNITVYIVGDSTACEYGYDENYAVPRAGWGMYVQNFLPDNMSVVNLALGGRSSKSFTSEENYTKLKENLKEGDYLLIQFGHNDAKKSTDEDIKNRYTDPEGDIETEGSFKNSLYENYIKLAEEKKAVPVLISPVSRRKFDEEGKITDSHGLYDDAVRELAEETGVKFVDMTKETEEIYNFFGSELTKIFHAAYKDKSKGIDNTHFNSFGAICMASGITQEIQLPFNAGSLDSLTRGEFIEYLMRTLCETEETSEENFKDIPFGYEYSNSIILAKKDGIANGNENGNFNPSKELKPYDMCAFIMRSLKYKGIEYSNVNISELEYIDKFSEIPSYAVQDCADFIEFTKQNFDKSTFNAAEYISEARINKMIENYLCDLINKNDMTFNEKDIFLIPVYEIILEKEKQEIVEQDLNELEKVENTK